MNQDVVQFFDEMLDGQGITKMIAKGEKRGIGSDRIRLAATIVYKRHLNGESSVTPMTAAHEVYRVAKQDELFERHREEIEMARKKDELFQEVQRLKTEVDRLRRTRSERLNSFMAPLHYWPW